MSSRSVPGVKHAECTRWLRSLRSHKSSFSATWTGSALGSAGYSRISSDDGEDIQPLVSSEESRSTVEPQPPVPALDQKPIPTIKSRILNKLCDRSGALTPANPPPSKLPHRAVATLPSRFKVKEGWGKKRQELEFDVLQPPFQRVSGAEDNSNTHLTLQSSSTAAERRLPTLSRQLRAPGSGRLLGPTHSSDTIRQAPGSPPTSTPPTPQSQSHAPSNTQPALSSSRTTLHERLRHTCLEDIQMLQPGEAREINELMLSLERDQHGPYATSSRHTPRPATEFLGYLVRR